MTLGEIFTILLISMLIFLPFVILFSSKVKNKLAVKDEPKNQQKKEKSNKKSK